MDEGDVFTLNMSHSVQITRAWKQERVIRQALDHWQQSGAPQQEFPLSPYSKTLGLLI